MIPSPQFKDCVLILQPTQAPPLSSCPRTGPALSLTKGTSTFIIISPGTQNAFTCSVLDKPHFCSIVTLLTDPLRPARFYPGQEPTAISSICADPHDLLLEQLRALLPTTPGDITTTPPCIPTVHGVAYWNHRQGLPYEGTQAGETSWITRDEYSRKGQGEGRHPLLSCPTSQLTKD